MRRWLIATFALHFFLSIGLFAFGQIDLGTPYLATAEHLDAKTSSHEGDLLGEAPDHGLTDSQPELPELIQLDVAVLAPGPHLACPADFLMPPIFSPALSKLRRPTRAYSVV